MFRLFITSVTAVAITVSIACAESDLVKRGDYLVNGILACGNCHTPKSPNGDVVEKAFSGGGSWDEPPFKVSAANITQDKETGIGSWTDEQIKTTLRKGARPNGVHLAAIMPSDFYEILTDNEIGRASCREREKRSEARSTLQTK